MAESTNLAKTSTIALTVVAAAAAAISAAAAFLSVSISRRRSRRLASRVRDLEASLAVSAEKSAAESRGRVRAQQALRRALAEQSGDDLKPAPTYPMTPIGTIRSCFSTKYGTPRQPILVPHARARLVFDPSRVPPGALEGFADYSHCWVLYVFHLNTGIEKIEKPSSQSKFKAKVRVPRLKGGKMGALATRSPHRPCPIGLTVAKVEALDGHSLLLSSIDIVDGTPVLDIKPYLPYSDHIEGATVPKWFETEDTLAVASVGFSPEFASSLSSCWITNGKHSLYDSEEEFQRLVKEVLSWDIRSLRDHRRIRPPLLAIENESQREGILVQESNNDGGDYVFVPPTLTYYLILEGIDISYKIDSGSNVIVENASLVSETLHTYIGGRQ